MRCYWVAAQIMLTPSNGCSLHGSTRGECHGSSNSVTNTKSVWFVKFSNILGSHPQRFLISISNWAFQFLWVSEINDKNNKNKNPDSEKRRNGETWEHMHLIWPRKLWDMYFRVVENQKSDRNYENCRNYLHHNQSRLMDLEAWRLPCFLDS